MLFCDICTTCYDIDHVKVSVADTGITIYAHSRSPFINAVRFISNFNIYDVCTLPCCGDLLMSFCAKCAL